MQFDAKKTSHAVSLKRHEPCRCLFDTLVRGQDHNQCQCQVRPIRVPYVNYPAGASVFKLRAETITNVSTRFGPIRVPYVNIPAGASVFELPGLSPMLAPDPLIIGLTLTDTSMTIYIIADFLKQFSSPNNHIKTVSDKLCQINCVRKTVSDKLRQINCVK